MDDLFEDQQYDPTIIPKEGKGAINLGLGMSVINMDMDEAGFLSANVWMKYQWTDYRLTWDPACSGDPTSSPTTRKNTMLRLICKQARQTSYNVVISSNGQVFWIPTVNLEVDCAGDEKILTIDDPSEPQQCHIKMGSWTYDANHINITTIQYETEKMGLNEFSINSRYVVTSQKEESIQTKVYDCCPEPYMHVDWSFKVQRAYHIEDGKKIFDMKPEDIYQVVKGKKMNI